MSPHQPRSTKRNRKKREVVVVDSGTCPSCLQYREDCECCPVCGEVDGHAFGCERVDTREQRRIELEKAPKSPRVPRPNPTERVPPCVVHVEDDAVGVAPTRSVEKPLRMHFVLSIETSDSRLALSPRQLGKTMIKLGHTLRKIDEAASIHGYEGRVRDPDGNTIGKWSWDLK